MLLRQTEFIRIDGGYGFNGTDVRIVISDSGMMMMMNVIDIVHAPDGGATSCLLMEIRGAACCRNRSTSGTCFISRAS